MSNLFSPLGLCLLVGCPLKIHTHFFSCVYTFCVFPPLRSHLTLESTSDPTQQPGPPHQARVSNASTNSVKLSSIAQTLFFHLVHESQIHALEVLLFQSEV